MKISIDSPLSDKFKWIRQEEGVSQQAFGDLIGVPQGTIAKIENGRNKSTSLDVIMKVVSHEQFAKHFALLLAGSMTRDQILESFDSLKAMEGYVEPPEPD